MPRIVDLGVTRYDWIPGANGLTTPNGPKLSELTVGGAKNISPFVVTTTNVNPTASDTVSEKGITDVSNAVAPSVGNYEGNLVLFRDLAAGVPTADDVFALLGTKGTVGWLTRRIGKAYDAALAVGDLLDVFLFMTDSPRKTGGQGSGYLKLEIPLLQQGTFAMERVVIA